MGTGRISCHCHMFRIDMVFLCMFFQETDRCLGILHLCRERCDIGRTVLDHVYHIAFLCQTQMSRDIVPQPLLMKCGSLHICHTWPFCSICVLSRLRLQNDQFQFPLFCFCLFFCSAAFCIDDICMNIDILTPAGTSSSRGNFAGSGVGSGDNKGLSCIIFFTSYITHSPFLRKYTETGKYVFVFLIFGVFFVSFFYIITDFFMFGSLFSLIFCIFPHLFSIFIDIHPQYSR